MGSISVLGKLPDGLNSDTLQIIIIALLGVCVLGIILVLRTVQKLILRVGLVILLAAFGGALWVQRDSLQNCKEQCSCRLFGQDVRVPDIATLNPQCRGL